MSKLSFRARALDAANPLPIYRGKDMPDLNDCVSINRAVPQMPTGMEKEEESVGTRVFITPPSLLPPQTPAPYLLPTPPQPVASPPTL